MLTASIMVSKTTGEGSNPSTPAIKEDDKKKRLGLKANLKAIRQFYC